MSSERGSRYGLKEMRRIKDEGGKFFRLNEARSSFVVDRSTGSKLYSPPR